MRVPQKRREDAANGDGKFLPPCKGPVRGTCGWKPGVGGDAREENQPGWQTPDFGGERTGKSGGGLGAWGAVGAFYTLRKRQGHLGGEAPGKLLLGLEGLGHSRESLEFSSTPEQGLPYIPVQACMKTSRGWSSRCATTGSASGISGKLGCRLDPWSGTVG